MLAHKDTIFNIKMPKNDLSVFVYFVKLLTGTDQNVSNNFLNNRKSKGTYIHKYTLGFTWSP